MDRIGRISSILAILASAVSALEHSFVQKEVGARMLACSPTNGRKCDTEYKSKCYGDWCPEWYIDIPIMIGMFLVFLGVFCLARRFYRRCIQRRQPGYVDPPQTDA